MASSLEDTFLTACKNGDLETVKAVLELNVDVNVQGGWGLRRAVRYVDGKSIFNTIQTKDTTHV